MQCPKCGMCYVPGLPEDESEHKVYCDLIVNGPSTQLVEDTHIVWREGEDQVIIVTDSSPEALRKIAHDLSICANRDMHYDGGIYHSCDPPDERQIQLFIYARANRGIGLLIFERRSTVWRCIWRGTDTPKCEEMPKRSPMWSIGFVWVREQFRKTGVTHRLLFEAQRVLKLSNGEFGWYTPFSKDGEAFVRRLYPTEFFVAK